MTRTTPSSNFGVYSSTWKTKLCLTNESKIFRKKKQIRDFLKTFSTIDYLEFKQFHSKLHSPIISNIFKCLLEILEKQITHSEDQILINGSVNGVINRICSLNCANEVEDNDIYFLMDLISPNDIT